MSLNLDSLEAVISNRANIDQSSMSIAGRSLSRMSVDELLTFRNRYKAEYLKEIKLAIDAIKEFTNLKIYINKKDLPKLDNNEAYWFELIDMEVIDKDSGDLLGKVSSLNNFGAQDCLEINPTKLSVDDEKRLIPFIRDEFIQSIEREKNIIYVNWDKTF